METDFTPGGYRCLIAALLARGYKTGGYADAVPARPHLILRHDIDLSPEIAVDMARLERELGVSAHYFVMMSSPFYNSFNAATRVRLRELVALGHSVGLHLDASIYPQSGLDAGAGAECQALEAITGQPVMSISIHRPAAHMRGGNAPIAGRPHTYQSRYFSEIGYCSDSRGQWAHGTPLDHPAVAAGRALQLLTHPIWWFGPSASDAASRLDRFLVDYAVNLDRELAENVTVHRAGRAKFTTGNGS